MTAPLDERFKEVFCDLATQYYVSARFAARGTLIPVSGNLFHHAVEMYLKAALIGTLSLAAMKQKPYIHDLIALWNRFKAKESDPALKRFNLTIQVLSKFESIRYPEKLVTKGMRALISWGPLEAGPASKWAKEPKSYGLYIADIDNLVMEVIQRMSVSPKYYIGKVQHSAAVREALEYENPQRAGWFN